jgi:sugar/nucleoside kinase (ribokinase family)
LDLLVLGEINPDIIVASDDPTPVFGQAEKIVAEVRLTIGSSASIVACGAARLGLRTGFYGVVGADPFGRLMLDAMASRGIDVSSCVVDPSRPTGASVVLTSGRDRAILTAIGTIDALDVSRVPTDLLTRARHIHVSSYFLLRASRQKLPAFLRSARQAGITTSLDCNWDPDERWTGIEEVLPAVDVFLPNAAEACNLTRLNDPLEAAHKLMTLGMQSRQPIQGAESPGLAVVVKLGAEGALAVRGDEVVHRPAIPVEVVDTTGAGDSFDAGFLAGWLTNEPLADAVAFGIACGSLSTRQLGGTEAQPTVDEVRAVLMWTE